MIFLMPLVVWSWLSFYWIFKSIKIHWEFGIYKFPRTQLIFNIFKIQNGSWRALSACAVYKLLRHRLLYYSLRKRSCVVGDKFLDDKSEKHTRFWGLKFQRTYACCLCVRWVKTTTFLYDGKRLTDTRFSTRIL